MKVKERSLTGIMKTEDQFAICVQNEGYPDGRKHLTNKFGELSRMTHLQTKIYL